MSSVFSVGPTRAPLVCPQPLKPSPPGQETEDEQQFRALFARVAGEVRCCCGCQARAPVLRAAATQGRSDGKPCQRPSQRCGAAGSRLRAALVTGRPYRQPPGLPSGGQGHRRPCPGGSFELWPEISVLLVLSSPAGRAAVRGARHELQGRGADAREGQCVPLSPERPIPISLPLFA